MTEQPIPTVADLLPSTFKDIEQVMQDDLRKSSAGAAPNLPGFAWHMVASEASTVLHEGFDCDLFSVLAQGWCFARELAAYKNKELYPADKKVLIFLGEHVLKTSVYPELILSVGPADYRPVRFTLELKADFRSAALVIQDARVTGIRAGDCFVSAQLMYGDKKLHKELDSRHVNFVGQLSFRPPGWPIA